MSVGASRSVVALVLTILLGLSGCAGDDTSTAEDEGDDFLADEDVGVDDPVDDVELDDEFVDEAPVETSVIEVDGERFELDVNKCSILGRGSFDELSGAGTVAGRPELSVSISLALGEADGAVNLRIEIRGPDGVVWTIKPDLFPDSSLGSLERDDDLIRGSGTFSNGERTAEGTFVIDCRD